MRFDFFERLPDGFHTTTFPMRAGAKVKLPPIAVKLNGEIANTNPSAELLERVSTVITHLGVCI
jgi:hypothetical protein